MTIPLQDINYKQDYFYISQRYPDGGSCRLYCEEQQEFLDPEGNGQVVFPEPTHRKKLSITSIRAFPATTEAQPTTLDIDEQGDPVPPSC